MTRKQIIVNALDSVNGNLHSTAWLLGISADKLLRECSELKIDYKSFCNKQLNTAVEFS